MSHTPEPWVERLLQRGSGAIAPEDTQRIRACVYACAGIPTEALEDGVVPELLEVLKNVLKIVPLVQHYEADALIYTQAKDIIAKATRED